MSGMLKPNDRKESTINFERFLENIIDGTEFCVDILVHSEEGNCCYYNVPCFVVTEKDYPYFETSYSFNVWWSKVESKIGNPPKEGFPNYPGYTEYKTYFNQMWFKNEYLEFRNIWKDLIVIYVFIHDDNIDNTAEMENIVRSWEK